MLRAHALLALGLTVAACGGGAGAGVIGASAPRPAGAEPSAAPSGSSSSAATPAESAAAAPTGSASAAPSSSAAPQTNVPQGPAVPEPRATTLADKLTALQLDPTDLPKFDDLTPTQLRGVMRLFTEALHVKCVDCHVEGDFAAPTPRKKIAVHMWDDLADRFTMPDAAPIFCDSCHQGRIKPLDRLDSAALKAGMQSSFVAKLKRKDDQAMSCTACHVSESDFELLAKWSR